MATLISTVTSRTSRLPSIIATTFRDQYILSPVLGIEQGGRIPGHPGVGKGRPGVGKGLGTGTGRGAGGVGGPFPIVVDCTMSLKI